MRWRNREPWRAFPELAELDGDQFQFLKQQTLNELDLRVSFGFITLMVTVVLTAGVFALLVVCSNWLFPFGCHSLRHIALRPQGPIALVLAIVLPALLIAWLRDWLIIASMRLHVHDNMAKAVCAACKHSLVSQTPVNGSIICPECGQSVSLQGVELSEEQWKRLASPAGIRT